MFEVRLASEDDQEEILALVGEMIPGIDVYARWQWLYETNPGGKALTWLATEAGKGGQVAGCTSFFPFRMWLDNAPVLAALGGDGYVRPAFRRRGLGGFLHDASRRDMKRFRIGCMYGAPGAMNLTPLKHGGSRELGAVTRWARPLRGAALNLGVVDGLVAAALKPGRRTARLEPMEPMDERVDAIWNEAKHELRLAAVRDSAFYTWRFLAAPAGAEPPFVIVDRKGKPLGACALEPMNDGRTCRIVDLFTLPGEWHTCLRAITRYATEETGARVIDIKLFSLDGRKRHMWRSGFTEREHKPFLCMIPKDGDRRFIDPDRWFYCGADSDLDRLE